MKKALVLAMLSLALVSCGKSATNDASQNSGQTGQTTSQSDVVKEGDTVSVDYVGKYPDGKVFDTSVADEAKKAGTYVEGRKYEPFQTVAKEGGGAIEGFWKALIGMKVGEKKTVTIPPKEAYGEEWVDMGERTVNKQIFDPTFERKVPVSETKDTISTQVPVSVLQGQGKLPKVGDTLRNEEGVSAKVTAIDDKNVSLEIDNSSSPFHGKKIAPGTTITYAGNPAKITAVDKDNVTLLVTNKMNPFAGKKLEVSLEGMYAETQKVKITKIDGDNITIAVSQKNDSPMAGKTLVFDLTVRGITPTK